MRFITEEEKDDLIGTMELIYGEDVVQTIDRNSLNENTYLPSRRYLNSVNTV